jgi:hypothetical protein
MPRTKKDTSELNRLMIKYPLFTFAELASLVKDYGQRKSQLKSGKFLDRERKPYYMNLSIDEWLDIWINSGKIEFRGTGSGKYCMMRNNDIGSYELDNVSIGLIEVNSKDAGKGRTPWNKGVKGLPTPSRKGAIPWNKGKKTQPMTTGQKEALSLRIKAVWSKRKGTEVPL